VKALITLLQFSYQACGDPHGPCGLPGAQGDRVGDSELCHGTLYFAAIIAFGQCHPYCLFCCNYFSAMTILRRVCLLLV